MNKSFMKKSSEELRGYLDFKKRGFRVKLKKGKGSYKRNSKYKGRDE